MKSNIIDINIRILIKGIDDVIRNYSEDKLSVHAFDVKETLLEIREQDPQSYFEAIRKIPEELMAEVIAEFPSHIQEESSKFLGIKKLAKITEEMDTDDAADFLQNISDKDEDKAEHILEEINDEDQEIIRNLISYHEDVAGAYMQTELFSVKEDELVKDAIKLLRSMKTKDQVDRLTKIFIIRITGEYICSIGLEELVLHPGDTKFEQLIKRNDVRKFEQFTNHFSNIKDVVDRVIDYDLSVIPVLDNDNKLIGRITSDDIYDLIENQATDDMFGMAGVNAEIEQAEDLNKAAKNRALWLGVNLLTAIAASSVVALFDETIEKYVSLAILMPIVASMGGNAGTQSLTVTVRQLSTGEIEFDDALPTIKKEITLSLMNGFLFAIIIGIISFYWFKVPNLGIVIALSTVINLLVAGISGSVIPLILEKWKIDPAVASSVLLTTITDMIGFFSFLGLAKVMM